MKKDEEIKKKKKRREKKKKNKLLPVRYGDLGYGAVRVECGVVVVVVDGSVVCIFFINFVIISYILSPRTSTIYTWSHQSLLC